MNNVQRACAMFKEGFVCSQAILTVYGADMGLDRETALKMAAAFGGGMGRAGQTCGAVTGALMVIGLAVGYVSAKDKRSKENTYAMVNNYISRFERIHGSVNCTELLGHDLGDPKAYQRAKKSGLFKTQCPKFVESAAHVLEEVLQMETKG